jgi:hypothetical protein
MDDKWWMTLSRFRYCAENNVSANFTLCPRSNIGVDCICEYACKLCMCFESVSMCASVTSAGQ